MQEEVTRDTLRGIVEMTPLEIAELKVLKERLYKQDKPEDEIKKEFQWKAELLKANIPPPYWNLTLDDFRGDDKVTIITKRYIAMLDEAFENGMGLLLTGKHGVGKTMLTCIIAKESLAKGYTIRYLDMSKILDMIMTGFGKPDIKERLETMVTGTEVLIIDDFGKEYRGIGGKLDAMVQLEMDRILRIRMNKTRITLGSTNYSEKELLNKYGESVFSVFLGNMHLVKVTGEDYRIIKGAKFGQKLTEGL